MKIKDGNKNCPSSAMKRVNLPLPHQNHGNCPVFPSILSSNKLVPLDI